MRFFPILLVVPLLGCDLFSVETSLDDVCTTLADRTVDGAPIGKLVRSYTADQLEAFDGFISLDAEITDVRLSLVATSGVSDLSFLQTVKISIASAGLPTVQVVDCENGACASATTQTEIAVTAPPHLVDYATQGPMQISLIVEGPLPANEWTADLRVCLSGKAKVSVGL